MRLSENRKEIRAKFLGLNLIIAVKTQEGEPEGALKANALLSSSS